METFEPTLETLFEQLGLEDTPKAIQDFIQFHALAPEVHIEEAPFWSDAQRTFIREALAQDDEWAVPVESLNALLHEAYSPNN